MNRFLIRIAAVVMVPCLMMDPITVMGSVGALSCAAAPFNRFPSNFIDREGSRAPLQFSLFMSQALASVSALPSPALPGPKTPIKTAAALTGHEPPPAGFASVSGGTAVRSFRKTFGDQAEEVSRFLRLTTQAQNSMEAYSRRGVPNHEDVHINTLVIGRGRDRTDVSFYDKFMGSGRCLPEFETELAATAAASNRDRGPRAQLLRTTKGWILLTVAVPGEPLSRRQLRDAKDRQDWAADLGAALGDLHAMHLIHFDLAGVGDDDRMEIHAKHILREKPTGRVRFIDFELHNIAAPEDLLASDRDSVQEAFINFAISPSKPDTTGERATLARVFRSSYEQARRGTTTRPPATPPRQPTSPVNRAA